MSPSSTHSLNQPPTKRMNEWNIMNRSTFGPKLHSSQNLIINPNSYSILKTLLNPEWRRFRSPLRTQNPPI